MTICWGWILDFNPLASYFLGSMRVEELEKLTVEDLRNKANEAFAKTEAEGADNDDKPLFYAEARFYMDEIERRENERIGRRDFRMELIVIALIALELLSAVGLAITGSRQQTSDTDQQLAAFSKIQDILSHLQDTSRETADTMKSVQGTMSDMKKSLDKQVELFYDVQINVVYNESIKKLIILNNGRSNITLWSQRVGAESDPVLSYPKPDLVAPGGTYQVAVEANVKELSKVLPNGQMREYSFAFQVKNEKQERFTVSGVLMAYWHGETVSFNIPDIMLIPGWNKK